MYKQKLQPYKETTKREDWPNTDLSARKFAEASGVKYPLYISSTTYRTNLYENYFISPRSVKCNVVVVAEFSTAPRTISAERWFDNQYDCIFPISCVNL